MTQLAINDFFEFDTYQEVAKSTAIYPEVYEVTYPLLGLAGEVGEFCNKWKKVIRDDNGKFARDDMISELGDILWYVAVTAADCQIALSEIAFENTQKLADRKARGVLGGSGDKR